MAPVSSSTPVGLKQGNDPLTMSFTNVQDLFDIITSTTRDFFLVTDVSPGHFNEIERERDKRRLGYLFTFHRYDSRSRVLCLTTTYEPYATLYLELYCAIRGQLVRSNQEKSWRSMGRTTFRGQRGPRGQDVGEGDSTGGPRPERRGRQAWPTLVVIAAVSEPLDELHNDMRWWFSASDHKVQIVLLTKFDYALGTLTLESWEEELRVLRPGATTTRQADAIHPLLRQSITITQDTTTDPVSYHITGPMVLGFKLLFLRDPGPGEEDIVLSVEDLEDYAERVWAML